MGCGSSVSNIANQNLQTPTSSDVDSKKNGFSSESFALKISKDLRTWADRYNSFEIGVSDFTEHQQSRIRKIILEDFPDATIEIKNNTLYIRSLFKNKLVEKVKSKKN